MLVQEEFQEQKKLSLGVSKYHTRYAHARKRAHRHTDIIHINTNAETKTYIHTYIHTRARTH